VEATHVRVYSAGGVQVGDTLELAGGFAAPSQRAFTVTHAQDNELHFTSAEPLPLEPSVLPGAQGLAVYSQAKRFVRVEVDQEAVLRLNGDTGNSVRLSPRVAGDEEAMGYFEKWGTTWALSVVNRSASNPMRVNLISAE
jgi:hypothetical protein